MHNVNTAADLLVAAEAAMAKLPEGEPGNDNALIEAERDEVIAELGKLMPTSGNHGALVYGQMPEASAERKVRYTWSNDPKKIDRWSVVASRFGDPLNQKYARPETSFVSRLTKHEPVPDISYKDKGFTWAPGVISGDRRTDDAVVAFDGLMGFDFDLLSDKDVTRLIGFLAGWGVTCVLVSSISHQLPFTNVPVAKLREFANKNGMSVDDGDLVEIGRAYLASKPEKYFPKTIASVHDAKIVTTGRETPEIDIYHAPQNRYRLVILEKDVRECNVLNPAKGEADHRQLYNDVRSHLADLGFNADKSTDNRGRMFYGARHIEGMPHEAIVFCGVGPADMSKVPQTDEGREAAAKALAGKKGGGKSQNASLGREKGFGNYQFRTPWLPNFIRKNGKDFQAADWYGATFPDDVRAGDQTEKVTGKCPWEDETHSPTNGPDMGWIITNPGTLGDRFNLVCQHESCNAPEHSNHDRARHLDKLIADFNDGAAAGDEITEAALLAHCPQAESERVEAERHDAEVRARAAEQISAAADRANGEKAGAGAVREAVAAIARLGDTAERISSLSDLARTSGWGFTDLRAILKDETAKVEETRAAIEQELRETVPVPGDTSTATVIWSHWPQPDQVECAVATFVKLNKAKPILFRRPDGGVVVVVNNTTLGSRFVEPENVGKVLQNLMVNHHKMKFISVDQETGAESSKLFPPHIIAGIEGALHEIELPELEKISRVPVFSKDGVLVTEKGYNPHTMAWYDPGDAEFYDVPDVVTEDDLDDAVWILLEPFRDFPFSDKFNERDDELIRSHERDEDGFPLPNYKRGRASRAHTIAMTLQPFVRAMIRGSCPNYHIDKPAAGTGAGYLVDVMSIINQGGEKAVATTLPHEGAEIRKVLTSVFLEGAPILFLDNVEGQVDSPDLAAALTAGNWKDRILGQSHMVTIPIRTTFIMAGNRIGFNEDMMRRNVPIYMNAATPNPAKDRGEDYYKYKNIQQYTVDNRKDLVWACHVIVKAWVQAGKPPAADKRTLQSFNSWSDVLGGILDHARISGFLENRDAYLNTRSDEQQKGGWFTERVWERFQDTEQTATALLEVVKADPPDLNGTSISQFGKDDFTVHPDFGFEIKSKNPAQGLGTILKKNLLGQTYCVDGGKVKVTWTVNGGNNKKYALEKVVG